VVSRKYHRDSEGIIPRWCYFTNWPRVFKDIPPLEILSTLLAVGENCRVRKRKPIGNLRVAFRW